MSVTAGAHCRRTDAGEFMIRVIAHRGKQVAENLRILKASVDVESKRSKESTQICFSKLAGSKLYSQEQGSADE